MTALSGFPLPVVASELPLTPWGCWDFPPGDKDVHPLPGAQCLAGAPGQGVLEQLPQNLPQGLPAQLELLSPGSPKASARPKSLPGNLNPLKPSIPHIPCKFPHGTGYGHVPTCHCPCPTMSSPMAFSPPCFHPCHCPPHLHPCPCPPMSPQMAPSLLISMCPQVSLHVSMCPTLTTPKS